MTLFGSAFLATSVLLLSACGADDMSENSMPSEGSCVIMTNEIQLSSGERCIVTEDQAGEYTVTAGEILCDQGRLTYGGNSFQTGDGLNLNGLTFICHQM